MIKNPKIIFKFLICVFNFWFLIFSFSSPCADTEPSSEPKLEELEALDSIRGKVQGEIVFQTKRGPRLSILKMNADGSGLKTLSHGKSNDQYPIWSADGKRIYFFSDRSGHYQIYSMDENGREVQNISQSSKHEFLCNIGSNGSKLLFQTREDGWMRAFVRELPTREVREVDFSEFPGREGRISPTLSPDGQKIAFLFKGGQGAGRSIYVGDLDDSYRLKNIVPVHLGCFTAWTKDSSRFIMCFFVPGGTALHLAKADGSEFIPITEGGRWNYFPAWSSDEEWFVWSASPTEHHDYNKGRYDIYIASMKDKKPIRLTFHSAPDISPSWRQ